MKKGTIKNKNAEVLRPPSGWMVVVHNGWRMGARGGERESRDLFDATRPSVKADFSPQRVQVQVVAEISESHDLFFR